MDFQLMDFRNYLFNRRLGLVLLLGFSSGLPLALTSSTLQAWYTVAGVNILTIGFLSLVGQPYIYKFLWAPIMDRFTPPFLGRRRGWMLITQVGLLASIVIMAFIDPSLHPYVLGFSALWVAFLSASQDINIDAYRTELLKHKERGMGAAFAVAGYRVGMLVSGGLALVLAQLVGWELTYILMALLMLVGMFASWMGPEPNLEAIAPESFKEAVINPFKDLFVRQNGMAILGFLFLYKLSYEFILVMTPTFLLRDLGFSLIAVGTINKGLGLIALMLGILLGGISLIRLNVIRALLIFGALQALTCLGYALLALVGKNYSLLVMAITAENFFAGLEASAFVAFLMSLCNHRYTAVQFAVLSALATLGRIFAGPTGALIVMHYGWVRFYIWSFLIAVPALLLLWFLKTTILQQTNLTESYRL